MIMISVEKRGTELASKVEDLREVSLEDLASAKHGAVDDALLRVRSDQSAYRVPVAAFNSSI
jgi:FXSXX-COOH protein